MDLSTTATVLNC